MSAQNGSPAASGGGKVTVVSTVRELQQQQRSLLQLSSSNGGNSGKVGLVPTMGCLHLGHLKLVELCARHCAHVVVSVFVNPAQFAPHEDFDKYPRQLASDVAALEQLCSDIGLSSLVVFAPSVSEMYGTAGNGGSGGSFLPHPTIPITTLPPAYVDVERFVSGKAEALSRRGFFSGVATVCAKLFCIVRPDVVVFGRKDRLQCYVIQQIVKDLSMPIEVVLGETTREANGLAMSSRNKYLTPAQFDQAKNIHKAMLKGQELVRSSGVKGVTVGEVVEAVAAHIRATVEGSDVVYVVVSDHAAMVDLPASHCLRVLPAPTAKPTSCSGSDAQVPSAKRVASCSGNVSPGIVSLAVRVGTTRLIDNMDL